MVIRKMIGISLATLILVFARTDMLVLANDSLETEVGVGFYGEWIWDEEPESPPPTSPTTPPETESTPTPVPPTPEPPTPPPAQRPPIRLPQTGAMVAMGGSIAIILLLSALLLLRKKKREAQKTTGI